jgi:hypothetical protein
VCASVLISLQTNGPLLAIVLFYDLQVLWITLTFIIARNGRTVGVVVMTVLKNYYFSVPSIIFIEDLIFCTFLYKRTGISCRKILTVLLYLFISYLTPQSLIRCRSIRRPDG